jgi:hypothetical protein
MISMRLASGLREVPLSALMRQRSSEQQQFHIAEEAWSNSPHICQSFKITLGECETRTVRDGGGRYAAIPKDTYPLSIQKAGGWEWHTCRTTVDVVYGANGNGSIYWMRKASVTVGCRNRKRTMGASILGPCQIWRLALQRSSSVDLNEP